MSSLSYFFNYLASVSIRMHMSPKSAQLETGSFRLSVLKDIANCIPCTLGQLRSMLKIRMSLITNTFDQEFTRHDNCAGNAESPCLYGLPL